MQNLCCYKPYGKIMPSKRQMFCLRQSKPQGILALIENKTTRRQTRKTKKHPSSEYLQLKYGQIQTTMKKPTKETRTVTTTEMKKVRKNKKITTEKTIARKPKIMTTSATRPAFGTKHLEQEPSSR